MPVSVFSYSVTEDTLHQKVDVGSLELEIRQSAITIAVEKINVLGDALTIKFKAALSPTAETNLDAIVAAHAGVALLDPPEVKVQEEKVKTGGHHQGGSLSMNVTVGAGTVTTKTFTWPIKRSLLSLEYVGHPDYAGDWFTVDIAPNTPVGVLLEDVGAGETVIKVSDTAFNYLEDGFLVHLADGSNLDDLGMVIGKNTVDRTITVQTATINSFSAATPTVVQSTRRSLYPLILWESSAKVDIGTTKIGASTVHANIPMVVTYTNNNTNHAGPTKPFHVVLEWMY